MRLAFATILALALATPAATQTTYQKEKAFKFEFDGLLRQEWTQDIVTGGGFGAPLTFKDERRFRAQLRPRIEIGSGRFVLGAGGDLNYGSDENTIPAPPATTIGLIRDNYDSRDARLDLAFLRLEPTPWLRLEGGRFEMPVGLTEMLWDRDLRPQGGALTLQTATEGSFERLALTGLYARGSHVFEDDETEMYVVSGLAVFPAGPEQKLEVTGSYIQFKRTDGLEAMIRRQNTRLAGAPAPAPIGVDFDVVDLVLRLRREGKVTSQLVADYSWNTSVDEDNRGLWLAAIFGSTVSANGSLEYVYAKVDKDATLAAYGTDDFFWVTGWQGHKVDLGIRAGDHAAFHVVGQLQKFKDSPRPEERDRALKRLRAELRIRS